MTFLFAISLLILVISVLAFVHSLTTGNTWFMGKSFVTMVIVIWLFVLTFRETFG